VDQELFFHRGRLIIPVNDHAEDLIFNVWTSISQENFNMRIELWEDVNRTTQTPYFGWLQTEIPSYGKTLNIKTTALEQEPGIIPLIRIIEDDHRLTIDQTNGISYQQALQIVGEALRFEHLFSNG
jgi:hypothetical protein